MSQKLGFFFVHSQKSRTNKWQLILSWDTIWANLPSELKWCTEVKTFWLRRLTKGPVTWCVCDCVNCLLAVAFTKFTVALKVCVGSTFHYSLQTKSVILFMGWGIAIHHPCRTRHQPWDQTLLEGTWHQTGSDIILSWKEHGTR